MRVRIGAYKRVRGLPAGRKKWSQFIISQVLMVQCWIAWGIALARWKQGGVVVAVGGFILAAITTTALMWIGHLLWNVAHWLRSRNIE